MNIQNVESLEEGSVTITKSINLEDTIILSQNFSGLDGTSTSQNTISHNGMLLESSLSNYNLHITGSSIYFDDPEDPNPYSTFQQGNIFSPSIVGNTIESYSNLTVGGTMSFQQTTEKVNTSSIASNVMTCDYTTGAIYYQSTNPSANFTANFTNVPTTNNKAITFTIFVTQGATAYLPNAVQIDGSAQTIKWAQGTTPTPTANKIDIFSFTLIRLSNAWTVFGNANTNF